MTTLRDEGSEAPAPVGVPGTIATSHRYEFALSREELWQRIIEVGEYRRWWPWLRAFDGQGLVAGQEWRCMVQPPVPYLVRFQVAIDTVEPATRVQARVLGDVVGRATLTLLDVDPGSASGDACAATLESTLAPGNMALRMVSRLAAPLARFGHDWVLDAGARQFSAGADVPVRGKSTPSP
jgi:hypothetical protein